MKTNVESHYSQEKLFEKIIKAFSIAGKDIQHLTSSDFNILDQFHSMGKEGTELFSQLIPVEDSMKVLDVGCGIGGTSRIFAELYNCHVTGIDLTEEYIKVANQIIQHTSMENISFQVDDAMNLSFADATFDIAYSQHVQMNIKNKESYLKEIYRILNKGGSFAYFDILKRSQDNLKFPLPWSTSKENSFLIASDAWDALLSSLGFTEVKKVNLTKEALKWFEKQFEFIKKNGPHPLGPQLLMGKDAPLKIKNLYEGLKSGIFDLEMGVFIKE